MTPAARDAQALGTFEAFHGDAALYDAWAARFEREARMAGDAGLRDLAEALHRGAARFRWLAARSNRLHLLDEPHTTKRNYGRTE